MTGVAVLAAVVLAYSLVSRRLELSAISAPMVFVAAGILAGLDVLDLVELDLGGGAAFHIAELTLALGDHNAVASSSLLVFPLEPGRP